jgi:regulation of enolase protein 1 (concanavalin A-like superfamily)
VTDPDRDCQVRVDGDKLTISIPAIRHDLSAELGHVNAPRVLRKIEGDFIAEVKVSGIVRHSGGATSEEFRAYHGAGLLLWVDGRNYVRLEQATITDEQGGQVHYANFKLRQDGKRDETSNPGVGIPDCDRVLRIERRKNQVLGLVSQDSIHWYSSDPIVVNWGQEIQLGVCATNTTTQRFKAEFTNL